MLRHPVLIAAFEGWNDAGDGASAAAAYLARRFGAEPFASIDPEDFFDFTATRPEVRIEDAFVRAIDWPANQFSSAPLGDTGRDVVFLRGVEPQLRWRTFCRTIMEVARSVGVELVITLGALLAEVAHTRPVRVTGTAGDRDLIERMGLRQSRYEGPTGILGVLAEDLREAGIPSASLWASVPAYVGQTPSPKAALALVAHVSELLGVIVPTVDLDVASAAYERQVNEVVAADEDATAYVRALEDADDPSDEDDGEDVDLDMEFDQIESGGIDGASLPGGDALAAEVERYLREHGPT